MSMQAISAGEEEEINLHNPSIGNERPCLVRRLVFSHVNRPSPLHIVPPAIPVPTQHTKNAQYRRNAGEDNQTRILGRIGTDTRMIPNFYP